MNRRKQLILKSCVASATALLAGCSSIPPVGSPKNRLGTEPLLPTQIRWPQAYKPDDATFTITNSISISAPPQVVWDQLIQAEAWPEWYTGATNVVVEGTSTGQLAEGSSIRWTTMGQNLSTNIVEFAPPYRMGWESRKATLKAYHAWLLVPTPDGTHVVTDESQFGLLAHLQRLFLPKKLSNLHDVWLNELKIRSEAAHSSGPTAKSDRGPAN